MPTDDADEPDAEDFAPDRPAPPPPPMTRRFAAFLACSVVFFSAPFAIGPLVSALRAPAWQSFSPSVAANERWTAELPGPPTVATTKSHDGSLIVTQARVVRSTGGFLVESTTFPPGETGSLEDRWERILDMAPANARRVVARSTATIDGRPARVIDVELRVGSASLVGRTWIVTKDLTLFSLGVIAPPGSLDDPDIDRFRESFRLPR